MATRLYTRLRQSSDSSDGQEDNAPTLVTLKHANLCNWGIPNPRDGMLVGTDRAAKHRKRGRWRG